MAQPRKVARVEETAPIPGDALNGKGAHADNQEVQEYPASLKVISQQQEQLDQLNQQLNEELSQVEARYSLLKRERYAVRADAARSLGDFWSKALKNHVGVGWTDEDYAVLDHVTDMAYEESPDDVITVTLTIGPNEHVDNEVLSKVLRRQEDGSLVAEHTTQMHWRDGNEGDSESAEGAKRRRTVDSVLGWFGQAEGDDGLLDALFNLWEDPLKYYLEPYYAEEVTEDVVVVEGGEQWEEGAAQEPEGEDLEYADQGEDVQYVEVEGEGYGEGEGVGAGEGAEMVEVGEGQEDELEYYDDDVGGGVAAGTEETVGRDGEGVYEEAGTGEGEVVYEEGDVYGEEGEEGLESYDAPAEVAEDVAA